MLTENYEFVKQDGAYRFETAEAAFEAGRLARQMLEGNQEMGISDILMPSKPPVERKDETSLEVNSAYDSATEAVEKAAAVLQGEDDFKELREWYDE